MRAYEHQQLHKFLHSTEMSQSTVENLDEVSKNFTECPSLIESLVDMPTIKTNKLHANFMQTPHEL